MYLTLSNTNFQSNEKHGNHKETYRVVQKVRHYQIKKIVLNPIKVCQWG